MVNVGHKLGMFYSSPSPFITQDTYHTVIGEVYEQMDNMLGEFKDVIEPRDVILYDNNHKNVVKWQDNLDVIVHALTYVVRPKYHSPSWLAQQGPRCIVMRKPHIDPKVQNRYTLALDKLVPEKEKCAQVQSQLSKYISEHGIFANLHATKCMAPLTQICMN